MFYIGILLSFIGFSDICRWSVFLREDGEVYQEQSRAQPGGGHSSAFTQAKVLRWWPPQTKRWRRSETLCSHCPDYGQRCDELPFLDFVQEPRCSDSGP